MKTACALPIFMMCACISAIASATDARKAVDVRQLSALEFGTLTNDGASGSATIDARNGTRVTSGRIATLGGMYGQAEFEITGQPGEEVTVFLPEEIKMENKKGAGSMTLSHFESEPSGILVLNQQGRARLRVGATATLSGSPVPGEYSGLFTVDARYLR